jgi:hypothetical protein
MCLALLGGSLSPKERGLLEKAARGSLMRSFFGFSSMETKFRDVVGFDRQLKKAKEFFLSPLPTEISGAKQQLGQVADMLPLFAREIHTPAGSFDFKKDRLNREARRQRGSDLSRRQYNKRFRFLRRLARKSGRVDRGVKVRELTMIGKSRLAAAVERADFSADDNTAAFVAYFVARSNLRSEFTVDGQQTALDEVAEMLFARCVESSTTGWYVVTQVYAAPRAIARLSAEEQGRLLARWFAVLECASCVLRELWTENQFNRETMVVARGNDSTTWNQTAGAWNKARDAWFALSEALGMEVMLARFCPGKVMRLMAADVAFLHRSLGKGIDPQTRVWYELPLPWEVLSGSAECSIADVEAACRRNEVDPVKTGWTKARRGDAIAQFKPTPELVHGVSVGNPALAVLLRRCGVFSGKG